MEFALVVIVLLLAFFAIVDLARLVATYSAATTASREAARYGVATGPSANGPYPQYVDCVGMKDAARRVIGGLVTINDADITLHWVPGATLSARPVSCGSGGAGSVASLERLQVQVSVTYRPITPLLQPIIAPITIVSIDRRTLVK